LYADKIRLSDSIFEEKAESIRDPLDERALEGIAVAGICVCTESARNWRHMDFASMIENIPILNKLNEHRKLVFLHIKQSVEIFLLDHRLFSVRNSYKEEFQSTVKYIDVSTRLEKKENELKIMNEEMKRITKELKMCKESNLKQEERIASLEKSLNKMSKYTKK
jgi:septal ring factor EnvC (AmiA/AmiB activator)